LTTLTSRTIKHYKSREIRMHNDGPPSRQPDIATVVAVYFHRDDRRLEFHSDSHQKSSFQRPAKD